MILKWYLFYIENVFFFYIIFFIEIERFEDPHVWEASCMSRNDNGIKTFWN